MRKASFPPVENPSIHNLILGSLPGDRSIREGQYYGHPNNRFWKLMASLTGNPLPDTYDDKIRMLLDAGTGLWDVAHSAARPGSMDHAIQLEEPNDLSGFLQTHPLVKRIGFNGKTAERLYDRYFERLPGISYFSLPSTSPANASFTMEKLMHAWSEFFSNKISY